MPKILVTTSSFDLNNFEELTLLKSNGFEIILNPYGKRLSEEQVFSLLDDEIIGIIAGLEPLNAKVLRAAKALKVVARCGIGLDNVDLQVAEELGIGVYNTPDAPTLAVAELTLAHILSLCRRITESDRLVRGGEWKSLMGSVLSKQTVGIIGYGRIGRMVAKYLIALGARVIIYDKYTVFEPTVESVSYGTLLSESDIISLHIPYSPQSHHMINSDSLALMKDGALLVNIARGGLIDEEALYSALKSGKIGGAALDCFESEPYNGPLLDCVNVQVSAHMGSYAKESRIMQEVEACRALMIGLRQQRILETI